MKVLEFETEECTFVKRLNRFTAVVNLNNEKVKAWMNNTGRLEEFLKAGHRCFVERLDGAKLKYRLLGFADPWYALIDTQYQEKAFLLSLKHIPWLHGCRAVKRHPHYLKKFDYLLDCSGTEVYAELKSAVLKSGNFASYPDCISERGREHIRALSQISKDGKGALIVFITTLADIEAFEPYDRGDPVIRELLEEALLAGVELRAISFRFTGDSLYLENPELPVVLNREVYSRAVEAVSGFRAVFGSEALATVTLASRKFLRVLFTGNFCISCGFYDYFDDFADFLSRSGIVAERRKIYEAENGAEVVYELKSF